MTHAQGIERNEIMGDWYEEVSKELQEPPCNFCESTEHGSIDCPLEFAPEQAAWTDKELEDAYQNWLQSNAGPCFNPDEE